MLKVGKASAAIVMSLILSLTILASGAFAQDITTTQNSTSAATRTATLTVDIQHGVQQILPTKSNQLNYRCYGRNCRYNNHYRRYNNYRRHGVRCRSVRRGWRVVRVCTRY